MQQEQFETQQAQMAGDLSLKLIQAFPEIPDEKVHDYVTARMKGDVQGTIDALGGARKGLLKMREMEREEQRLDLDERRAIIEKHESGTKLNEARAKQINNEMIQGHLNQSPLSILRWASRGSNVANIDVMNADQMSRAVGRMYDEGGNLKKGQEINMLLLQNSLAAGGMYFIPPIHKGTLKGETPLFLEDMRKINVAMGVLNPRARKFTSQEEYMGAIALLRDTGLFEVDPKENKLATPKDVRALYDNDFLDRVLEGAQLYGDHLVSLNLKRIELRLGEEFVWPGHGVDEKYLEAARAALTRAAEEKSAKKEGEKTASSSGAAAARAIKGAGKGVGKLGAKGLAAIAQSAVPGGLSPLYGQKEQGEWLTGFLEEMVGPDVSAAVKEEVQFHLSPFMGETKGKIVPRKEFYEKYSPRK
jgi:hypothetical protein